MKYEAEHKNLDMASYTYIVLPYMQKEIPNSSKSFSDTAKYETECFIFWNQVYIDN